MHYALRLFKLGIDSAYHFVHMDPKWVQKYMSIVGLRLQRDLSGVPALGLEEVADKQNIATTRSFDSNYTDYETIKERVVTFAASCSEKLRKQHSHCNSLTVFLHTNRHRQDQQQYNPSITVDLPYASNSAIDLGRYATIALKKIYREGFGYKTSMIQLF